MASDLHSLIAGVLQPMTHAELSEAPLRIAGLVVPNGEGLSKRQRIDLARIYAKAIRTLPTTIDGQPPLPVPADCPVTLDQLVADD